MNQPQDRTAPRPAAPAAAPPPPGVPPFVPLPAVPPAVFAPVPLGPPRPTAVQRYWPAPARPASRAARMAVAGAGLVAAITLVPTRPGLGWPLTGLAVVGATSLARSPGDSPSTVDSEGPRSARGAWRRLERVAWAGAALALLAVGAVRSAGWLFAWCVAGALISASIALAGGRSVRGLAAGAAAGAAAAFRALPWVARGMARARTPAAAPDPAGSGGRARTGLATLVAVGLVALFTALFASADARFARLLTDATPRFDGTEAARSVFCFVLVGLLAGGAAYLAASRPRFDEVPAARVRPVRRLEWVIPLGAVDAVFLAFALVQVVALVTGQTRGADYARYTRSGFFQLVAVTVLALVVLGVAARIAPRGAVRDRVLLRALLGGLAVFTLVVVASAMTRLVRYEDAYGFTRLRVLVGAVEIWLGVLFVLVLAAGVRLRAGWLPRAVAGTAVVGLLAVAALDPDRFVAARNVDRWVRTGDIDVVYLSGLSADAAPELDRLPDGLRDCAMYGIATDLADADDWRTANLARARARDILRHRPDRTGCDEFANYR